MAITRQNDANKVVYSLGNETVLEAVLQEDGGKTVLKIEGAVKTLVAPCLDEVIKETMAQGNEFVIDFSGVSYIASAGLRVLLNMQQEIDENDGPEAVIVNVSESVREVFEQTGFINVLNIED